MFIANLTKEYIFKNFSQEEIFERYGCSITNKLFISPIRKDSNPTCKFSYYNGVLIYHDNRPGEFVGDCINFVKTIKNITYKQALLEIYNNMGNNSYIKKDKSIIKDTKNTTIKLNFKEFTEEDINYWNQYSITLETLKYFNVYSVRNVYIKNKEGEYFDCRKKEELCFAYLFPDNTVKVYFPNRDAYRFITNSTHLQGYEYLKDPEILLITKSFKDVIVAHTLGIQAVAVQSESVSPPKEIIDTFNCVWLGDQDYCGRKATIRIRDTFGIPVFLIPKEYNSKDLSDLVKNHGLKSAKDLVSLAHEKIRNISNN